MREKNRPDAGDAGPKLEEGLKLDPSSKITKPKQQGGRSPRRKGNAFERARLLIVMTAETFASLAAVPADVSPATKLPDDGGAS